MIHQVWAQGSQSRPHVREVALQFRKQIAEATKALALEVIITGDPIRFSAVRSMNAIENRAPGRQALQAHPSEYDATLVQRVAGRENGMEELFFQVMYDLDRCDHPAYTQNAPLFSGALPFNDLRG